MTRLPPAERRVLAGGMVAASLVPLNSTMIAVGLPDIADDLDVTRGAVASLVVLYLIAMAVCQPVAGRAGDRFGSQRIAISSLVGFGTMSGVAAVAPSFALLLAARVAQAVFGAALIPNVQAIVRSAIAPERRGRAFGILGVGIGAGAAIGPVLGGVLVDAAGWRSIFLVNAPVAGAAIVLVRRARVAVGAVAPEAHAGGRLLHGAFLAACTANASSNLAQYTVLLAVPLLLDGRGWTSSQIGFVLLGMTAGMVVLNPRGGALGDRIGHVRPVVLGMSALTAGAVALAVVADDVPALLVASVVLTGVGMGLATASLQAAALEAVPEPVVGAAAGLFSTSRYVGSITGSLLLAALGPRSVLFACAFAAALAVAAGGRIAASPVASSHR